jgi:hypothetical protein
MASVEDLLLASRARKSPLQALLEGAARGFGEGYEKAPQRAKLGLEIADMQESQRRQAEMEAEVKKTIEQQTEAANRQRLNAASTGVKSAHPAMKFKQVIEQDEKGRYSRKFEQDTGAGAAGGKMSYTPAQLQAIADATKTRDITKLGAAFPDGVPDDTVKQVLAGERIDNLESERDARAGERRQSRFRNYFLDLEQRDPVIKELRKQDLGLMQVNDLIEQVKAGNTIAANAMGTKMARGMGEVGVLTDADVTRYVQSGRLDRKVGDKLSLMLRGRPTDASVQEIDLIAQVLREAFEEKIQPRYNQFIDTYSKQEGMKPEDFAGEIRLPYTRKAAAGAGAKTPEQIAAMKDALRKKLKLGGNQ